MAFGDMPTEKQLRDRLPGGVYEQYSSFVVDGPRTEDRIYEVLKSMDASLKRLLEIADRFPSGKDVA